MEPLEALRNIFFVHVAWVLHCCEKWNNRRKDWGVRERVCDRSLSALIWRQTDKKSSEVRSPKPPISDLCASVRSS